MSVRAALHLAMSLSPTLLFTLKGEAQQIVLGKTYQPESELKKPATVAFIKTDTGWATKFDAALYFRKAFGSVRRRLLPSHGDRFLRWTAICPARMPGSGMAYLASILDGRKAS